MEGSTQYAARAADHGVREPPYTGPMANDHRHGKNHGAADDPWAALRIAAPDPHFALADIDPSATPFSSGDKSDDRAEVDRLAGELDTLQNLFYADHRYKLLIVLQGLDTSGKDGTLRAVLGRMSPIGVRTASQMKTASLMAHPLPAGNPAGF